MALTDLKIKNAKPKDLPYRLSDSGGLHLYVSPAGGKLWRWKYRFGSKEKLMSFGSYPEVSLVAARAMHQEQRAKLAAGTDPMAERKAEKTVHLRKAENSFERVAKAWFAKWKHGKCQRHADYMARRMEADILPRLGPRQIDEIQPPDIVAMIQAIEERGATDVARRALQSTNQIFRYAVALGYPQPPPPSKNNTKRTINTVSMVVPHLYEEAGVAFGTVASLLQYPHARTDEDGGLIKLDHSGRTGSWNLPGLPKLTKSLEGDSGIGQIKTFS